MIAKARGQLDIFGQVKCPMCGRSFPIDVMEVDHINPCSKGGRDNPANLQLLAHPATERRGPDGRSPRKFHPLKGKYGNFFLVDSLTQIRDPNYRPQFP